MDIIDIELTKLHPSDHHVRKTVVGDFENDLALLEKDIENNGLLNPIIVRPTDVNGTFEILSGQLRFLAYQSLGRSTIPCHVVEVDDDQAEEISFTENLHRRDLTTCDKVVAYSKFYETCNRDIGLMMEKISVKKPTLQKYLSIRHLPLEVLKGLDGEKNDENKISLAVATELTKLPDKSNIKEVVKSIANLSAKQKIVKIKELCDKKQPTETDEHKLKSTKTPFVINESGKQVKIPDYLYGEILDLIRNNSEGYEYL